MRFPLKLLTVAALLTASAVSQSRAAQRTIRWVVARGDEAAARQAAQDFAGRVARETNGAIEIEVVPSTETPRELIRRVISGRIDMTMIDTTLLGRYSRELWLLDLPYLFRSHEHAAQVLGGDIGHQLLASLRWYGVHGLAFTYDGGYRVLTASRGFRRPAGLHGLRVRTANAPVAKAIFRDLDAEPVTEGNEAAEASESTLERCADGAMPVITDTRHSLSFAAIVINGKTFSSLPPQHQAALTRSALETADDERRRSINAGARAKERAAANGKRFVELDSAERARFAAHLQSVYTSFPRLRQLVERIRQTR